MSASGKHLGYFLMVASGVFLSTMDSSMINIALPYIMRSFSSSLAAVEWVVLMYLFTISISLLLWGKISDKFGKGIIYLIGMFIFSMGSLSCYFSTVLVQLVFSRFIQGMGAAMMMATGPAIIRLAVPQHEIGKWIGSLGIATSLGLMSGPLIGGFILHNFSWRTLFLLNLPISLTVSIFGWLFIAGTLPRYVNANSKFDWLGSLFWVVLIGLIVFLLNLHNSVPFYLGLLGFLILAGVAVSFIRHEIGSVDPLLPISLLRQDYYGIAMLCSTLSFAVLFFVLILMPFYLNFIVGLTFDKIGYMMMAVPVSLFIVSPIAGRLFDRFGAKYLTSIGMSVTALAIYFLSSISHATSLGDIAWRLSLLGCGQSIFLSPNSASVLSRVAFEDTGITSGMLATCRNLGMLLGVALVGMIFSNLFVYFTGGIPLREYTGAQLPYFMQAFRYTLIIASAIALVTAFISLRRN